MRKQFFATAVCLAVVFAWTKTNTPLHGVGRPGITPVPCGSQAWTTVDPAFEALPGAKAYFGSYEGGAYHVEIPDKWNGELVLSAHGYVAASGERGLQLRVGTPLFRQHLIEKGYAWAASSYRCNGYVPGHGLLDTMALTELFTKFNGGRAAERVYLTGTSMGGHVTVLGMHEFPTAFTAGMAMCASGPELFDYDTAVSAAAEVVSGIKFEQGNTREAAAKMNQIFGAPPNYTDKGRAMADIEIDLSGGPRPFAVEGLASGGRFASNVASGANSMAGGTNASSAVTTNANYKYAIDAAMGLAGDRMNAMVRRKQPDMKYRDAMGPYDELVPFDGKIERPLLTLHGTGDLFVPINLEQSLNRAVVSAGKQDLLVQRIYRIAGHCGFNAGEEAQSFDDLVAWVKGGKKPEGDTIVGDLSNAGLKFTKPLRDGDPGTRRLP
jgi:pimeloyl-ACP methyl ester carboxylesterase